MESYELNANNYINGFASIIHMLRLVSLSMLAVSLVLVYIFFSAGIQKRRERVCNLFQRLCSSVKQSWNNQQPKQSNKR